MEVAVQIFCGGFSGKSVPFELIEQKLLSILPRFRVTKVIMGWSADKTLYEKTAGLLSKHKNIEFYLWFPVFSETGAIRELSELVDISGNKIERGDESSDEDFFFCCPNNRDNIRKIIDIFSQNFSSIKFNGVFLDKIRYPSFSDDLGNRSVFTCFCPDCSEVYKKENFDINKLKAHLYDPESSLLGISKYSGNGNYIFHDNVMSSFFQLKKNIIYYSLQKICMYFRERNYDIGFDVFAPFLSPFTGQDIKKLSGLCDFIKPMMYRITNAPAGLPFETNALLQQTCNENAVRSKHFYKMLGIKPELLSDGFTFKNIPFDLNFSARELQKMAAESFCPVYAGIEINSFKGISQHAQADPLYIEETINAYSKTGVHGYVLSWNLLDMPEENIAKAAELI